VEVNDEISIKIKVNINNTSTHVRFGLLIIKLDLAIEEHSENIRRLIQCS